MNNTLNWERITSIKYIGEDHVYDLEIEGTHNFVGNDIVAHNTYISGNTGIGFTSPDRILQLGSDIDIVGSNASLLGAGGTQFSISGDSSSGTQKKLVLGLDTTDNYGVIQAGSAGTNYALSLSPAGGNVGIGTTTANSTLTVVGNASIGGVYTGISPPANSLFVHGNVGVGNTTSDNKLDVWGNARVAGTLTVDSCTGCGGASSWSSLTAPSSSLSLDHAANTTTFTFNSVTTGNALTLSSTGLTTGNLLTLNNTNATSTGSNISLANSGTGAAIEYTTTPIAAGATGSYSTLTSLSQTLANHSAISYNGYLFVTGGRNSGYQSTVYSAQIKSDGTIGSFSTLTYLPATRAYHSSVVYNGYLFVTGGNNSTARQSTVWSAPIRSDGTIGAFTTLTYLPAAREIHSSVVYNGYLFVTGGYDGTNMQSTVYSAPIKSDGTIGSFSTLTYLPQALYAHSITSYNGYVFVTGGVNTASAIQSTVYSAPIKADGTIGAFTTLTYLPNTRYYHSSVSYNGYLFVTGGLVTGGATQSTVYSAPINSNGTIGSFSTLTYLPAVRSAHSSVSYNGYLFVTGGQDAGGSVTATVYSTPLQSTALAVNTSNNFAQGNLLDLWNNSISKFSVDYAGNVTTQGNYVSDIVPKSDGTTGSYSTLTSLPAVRENHTATSYNGYLFVTGGLGAVTTYHSTVWSAPIKSDGTLGSFSTLTYLPDERYDHTATSYNGYLLVSGGADATGVAHSTVWSAPIKSDGTIGAFSTLTYLPATRPNHTATSYNGYLFVTGGQDAFGNAQSTVWSAPIKSDGTIGAFSTLTYLPSVRATHTATVYNGYLFVTGGGDTTVYSASLTTSRAFTFNANSQTWPEGTGLGGNASLFTLQNNGDAVANFTAYGDLLLRGKLSANSVVIGTDVPGDLAENMEVLEGESVEAGDVVSVGPPPSLRATAGSAAISNNDEIASSQTPRNDGITKSTVPYQSTIIGVISTSPSITLSPKLNGKPVALSGRVPVKVSTENGPIEVGDYLTSSSVPGVAMKALRPGQVLGKALESFNCHPVLDTGSINNTDNMDSRLRGNDSTCQGKILVFVNITYADPGNFFASLSFDNQGNLIIPKLKVDSLQLADISLATASSSLRGTFMSTERTVAISSSVIASDSEAISINDQIASSSATPRNDMATLNLTPPDILYATPSAQLELGTGNLELGSNSPSSKLQALSSTFSDATVSGMLTAYQGIIQDHFKVLGQTTLSSTQIAGDLNIDGTLSIDNGSEINVIGTSCHSGLSRTDSGVAESDSAPQNDNCGILYLQSSPLAHLLDIFNGKVTIDRDGTLQAVTVVVDQFKFNKDKTGGSATIPAGETEVVVENPYVEENSLIIITPNTPLLQSLAVIDKRARIGTTSASFKIKLTHPEPKDLNFDYLIIGQSPPL